MWLFDLSRNQLSGGIPPSLANMQQLRDLNLGQNSFNGTIPSQFGSMLELKYLRFSRNRLSGKLSMKPESVNLWCELLNAGAAIESTAHPLRIEVRCVLYHTRQARCPRLFAVRASTAPSRISF